MVHMAVIGTICPNAPGHLNPLTTLCRELQRRGHRVIFYQVPLAALLLPEINAMASKILGENPSEERQN